MSYFIYKSSLLLLLYQYLQIPPEELNMPLVKALQSLCLLLSYDVSPINSSDEGMQLI